MTALKNKGAVLFIGPDIEKDDKGEVAYHAFAQKMVKRYEGEVEIDSDGFFFFVEPEAETDVTYNK